LLKIPEKKKEKKNLLNKQRRKKPWFHNTTRACHACTKAYENRYHSPTQIELLDHIVLLLQSINIYSHLTVKSNTLDVSVQTLNLKQLEKINNSRVKLPDSSN